MDDMTTNAAPAAEQLFAVRCAGCGFGMVQWSTAEPDARLLCRYCARRPAAKLGETWFTLGTFVVVALPDGAGVVRNELGRVTFVGDRALEVELRTQNKTAVFVRVGFDQIARPSGLYASAIAGWI